MSIKNIFPIYEYTLYMVGYLYIYIFSQITERQLTNQV